MKILRSAFDGMTRDAESGYPCEVCGVMIGAKDTVTHFRKCRNLVAEDGARTAFKEDGNIDSARTRDRYELDPLSYVEADSWARERGLDILGVYHSHPDHPPVPSETDRKAASPGWGYMILSVSRGRFDGAGIWYVREEDSKFEEAGFEVVEDAG